MIALPRTRARTAYLVISVHDATPASGAGLELLLAALDARGLRPRVLCVIPNYQGRFPVTRTSSFGRRLEAAVAAGDELVVHGHTHWTEGPPRGPFIDRLRARWFAGPAAEFQAYDGPAARQALAAARQRFEAAGLAARGFCPPGWLIAPEARPAVADAGFRFLVAMNAVTDLVSGRRHWLPAVGYMGVGPLGEALVGWYNRLVALPGLGRYPAVQVFLHPPRRPGDPALARVLSLLERLAQGRKLTTYSGWLEAVSRGRR